MWLWIWLGVTAVSLIIEFITMEIASIWFVFGGVVAMILAAFNVSIEIQVVAFIVVSLVLLLSFRKLSLKHLLKKSNVKTNAERAIGESKKLLTAITDTENGSININGVIWTAVTCDGSEIAAGTFVDLVKIQGNKYIVQKKQTNDTLTSLNANDKVIPAKKTTTKTPATKKQPTPTNKKNISKK